MSSSDAGNGAPERDTDFEPVMSAEEALMWRVGSDPWLDPSGGLLAVLDQPIDTGLVRRKLDGVRILAKGEITSKVDLSVTGASAAAKAAVEAKGGSLTVTASPTA